MSSSAWPYCVRCDHVHIPDIPEVTYGCRDCGFGAWEFDIAADHVASPRCVGHRIVLKVHELRGERFTPYVDLLFTEPPGPDSQFVETENEDGEGVSIGTWIAPERHTDAYWRLRIHYKFEELDK